LKIRHLAASLLFQRTSGDGASVSHCEGATSMTAGRCAATYNANSNSGLILPLLHAVWDPTWNQWKHLLETKIEVEGTFVQSGKYRKRGGAWDLLTWETALPSRLEIKLPSDFQQQLEKAQRTYHRFGQYFRALDQIRLHLEHHAVERAELERMCSELHIPGDFDVAQISWRADCDPFFYRQLSRRARGIAPNRVSHRRSDNSNGSNRNY
jgi:hypothetical protein